MDTRLKRKQQETKDKFLEEVNSLFVQAGEFFQNTDYSAAQQKLQQVVDLMPQHHLAWRNLGECARMQGEIQYAGFCLNRAIDENPKFYKAYEELAELYQEYQLYEQATSVRTELLYALQKDFEQQVNLDPHNTQAAINLAKLYDEVGEFEKANQLLAYLAQTNPCLESIFAWQVKYPPIFQNIEEQEDHYERISFFLDESLAHVEPQSGFPTVFPNLPFYNAYLHYEPKIMQQKLANWYLKVYPALAFEAPHIQGWKAPRDGRKVRLGFVSSMLNTKDHSVANTILDLIHALPEDQFEVTVFAAKLKDKLEGKLSCLKVVKLPTDHAVAHQIISDHQLDILYYTDVGMDDFTYFLAFARLAPVQCVWSGHPITTGIPTLDYYMSTTLLDEPGAEQHYSETLVRLEGAITRYPKPKLSLEERPASFFGLPEDKNLYFCAQYLFKIHPCMDSLFAEILRRDPNGVLIIIESKPGWKEHILRRWQHSMHDVIDQIIVLPLQPFDHFLSLLKLADVVLDTMPFASGNTAYQAFAAGTPIITYPGSTLRGRGTYSLYHLMGMNTECIATHDLEYIEKAVYLGTHPEARAKISEQILSRCEILFDDLEPVKAQANFLKEILNHHKQGGRP